MPKRRDLLPGHQELLRRASLSDFVDGCVKTFAQGAELHVALSPPTMQGLALFSRPRSVFSIVFQQYSRELGTRQAPAAAVLSVPSQHERDLPRLTTCTGNCGR